MAQGKPENGDKTCTCPKNVMRCIGIIGSSPLIRQMPDSDSDDSMDENLLRPFLLAANRARPGQRSS